jgi:hypothetical protein
VDLAGVFVWFDLNALIGIAVSALTVSCKFDRISFQTFNDTLF